MLWEQHLLLSESLWKESFFGVIIHEVNHATICLIHGLPFSSSWSHVTYKESENYLVNLQVRLARGLDQSAFSLLFFWFTGLLEKEISVGRLDNKKAIVRNISFGFRLAFLTISIHGVVTAFVEGLLYDFYAKTHNNLHLWGIIHVQTLMSDGHSGIPDQFYTMGKEAYGWDFAAVTDHYDSYKWIQSEFAYNQYVASIFNNPPDFIGISGYEWTRGDFAEEIGVPRQGHKCILYETDDQPFFSPADKSARSVIELSEALKKIMD